MPHQVQLSIPQPCHQDWQKMTPSQQGRFCGSCAKQVVDFTTMSDTEVLHFFLNKKDEKVCGRMYPDQLNRPVAKPTYPQKKKFWHWNYAAMLLLFFSKTNSVKAQGYVKAIKTEQAPPDKSIEIRATLGKVSYRPDVIKAISGNITDENGEPVPFATVQIKGSKSGVAADANGRYSIKANTSADVLQISAVAYETQTIPLKNKNTFDAVLTASKATLEGDVVVTVGGISSDYEYFPPANPKHIAILEVKDNATNRPVKATVSFKKDNYSKINSATTDAKGVYKLKRITENAKYIVKVSAPGYTETELIIKGWELTDSKVTKNIFLEKIKPTAQTSIRLGMVSSNFNAQLSPLYVVDGLAVNQKEVADIKPEKIERIDVLKGNEATAIYGSVAVSGVILITTKKDEDKPKYKNLKEVVVSSGPICILRKDIMGAVSSGITIKQTVADTLNLYKTKLTGTLKIAPNPVQRGTAFNLSFTVKETGNYYIQITTAVGQVVKQQQINAAQNNITIHLMADINWAAGIYYLRLVDANNNVIGTNRFSVQ